MKTYQALLSLLLIIFSAGTQAGAYTGNGDKGNSWTPAMKSSFMNSCNRTGTLTRYCECAMQETERMFGDRIIFKTREDRLRYSKQMYQACGHLIPRQSDTWPLPQQNGYLRSCHAKTRNMAYCKCTLSAMMKRYSSHQIANLSRMNAEQKTEFGRYLIRQCVHTLRQ